MTRNKKFKFILNILVLTLFFSVFSFVSAGPIDDGTINKMVGTNSLYEKFIQSTGFQIDAEPGSELGKTVALVIKGFLSLLGIIFIILIILSGFNWMISEGDEQKITKAKETIKTAIIGLFIVIASYSITHFVFNALPWAGN